MNTINNLHRFHLRKLKPLSMRFCDQILNTHKGPIVYHSCGKGPPVLMIHGFLGRPQDFRWLLPEVSKHCQVFIPELPGMVTTDLDEHAPLDQTGMTCSTLSRSSISVIDRSLAGLPAKKRVLMHNVCKTVRFSSRTTK